MNKRGRIIINVAIFIAIFTLTLRTEKIGVNASEQEFSKEYGDNIWRELENYETSIDACTYNNYYIPSYDGDPFEYVNNNDPVFEDSEMTIFPFEKYSELDELGRCGVAYANVCKELMPTNPRGSLSSVIPSGWIQVKYDKTIVPGRYLYNRSHLIGWQLTGENANKKNLITGTRQLNVNAMLPFENKVDSYVEQTENHVLYRVTPIFEGNNLVANGVLIEAESVEESQNEEPLQICVFCYNVQKGIAIDYSTGKSILNGM